MTILAGNVTSGNGVEYLAERGADAIKVGQGPDRSAPPESSPASASPAFRPFNASKGAAKKGVRIIADGGITKSGDIVKAMTLADSVMLGGLLAGSREAPGDIVEINNKLYKQYRGMGSLSAMKKGSAARYGHKSTDTSRKMTAEGIEGLKEVQGSVANILAEMVGGLQGGNGLQRSEELGRIERKVAFRENQPSGHERIHAARYCRGFQAQLTIAELSLASFLNPSLHPYQLSSGTLAIGWK